MLFLSADFRNFGFWGFFGFRILERLLGSGPLWGAPSREIMSGGGIGVRIRWHLGRKLAADIDDPALVLGIFLKQWAVSLKRPAVLLTRPGRLVIIGKVQTTLILGRETLRAFPRLSELFLGGPGPDLALSPGRSRSAKRKLSERRFFSSGPR